MDEKVMLSQLVIPESIDQANELIPIEAPPADQKKVLRGRYFLMSQLSLGSKR